MALSIEHRIGIGEMIISSQPADVLTAYSLSSCVGLALYDRQAMVGGMIHCLLPYSRLNMERALESPCLFVDTGVEKLIEGMIQAGSTIDQMVATAAGAAAPMNDHVVFRIGQRNYDALQEVLWRLNLSLSRADVGGTLGRSLSLEIKSGRSWVRTALGERELS